MIEVKYFERGDRFQISAIGHANSAPHGQDLVCASVSTILQALAIYLEKYNSNYWNILEIRLEEGNVNIEAIEEDIEVGGLILKHLFNMCMEFLQELAKDYPGFIKII